VQILTKQKSRKPAPQRRVSTEVMIMLPAVGSQTEREQQASLRLAARQLVAPVKHEWASRARPQV
jgi:hypothetical protein